MWLEFGKKKIQLDSVAGEKMATFSTQSQEKARFLHAVFDASGRGLGTGSEIVSWNSKQKLWSDPEIVDLKVSLV